MEQEHYRKEICSYIKNNYPDIYLETKTLPKPFQKGSFITSIVLGTDPSNKSRHEFKYVFGLGDKRFNYFNGIKKNLRSLAVVMSEIYVQNVVQNYFTVETSGNKYWYECALLWLEYLKTELDGQFDQSVPVFLTAWDILEVLVGKQITKEYSPDSIYSNCKIFTKEENCLGRNVICLFRHPKYNIRPSKWFDYSIKVMNVVQEGVDYRVRKQYPEIKKNK